MNLSLKPFYSLSMVAFALSFAGITQAQPPWQASLEAADASYQRGDFGDAVRRFDRVRAAIGQDDGWTDSERMAYDATRCHRALARLTFGPSGLREDDWERQTAVAQAAFGCGGPEQAVAAFLMGDSLQAALRLQDSGVQAFPGPFAGELLPADARTFALEDDRLPLARNLAQAERYVQAYAGLRYGLEARCGVARGIDWTLPRERRPIDMSLDDDQVARDLERQRTLRPFQGDVPDRLATLRCTYPPNGAPEELDSGGSAELFLLRREADGRIRTVGSYRDSPDLDCWTSVIQSSVANYHATRQIYVFIRSDGYSEDEGLEEIVVTATLCDVARLSCRSLPIQIRQRDYSFNVEGDPTLWHRDWHARLMLRGGRVRLVGLRGAPPELEVFRRGVPFARFFSAPDVAYTIFGAP